MPSKIRKKKRKKTKAQLEQEQQQFEFKLLFTDVTMSESEGIYDIVKELFEEEAPPPTPKRFGAGVRIDLAFRNSEEWTVKTNLNIISPLGEGSMLLDFNHDRGLYILQYNPSTSDFYYNPDIQCLTRWSQIAGWNIPQPTESLVRENTQFWKHQWETLLIDSPYLDHRYGIRKSLDIEARQETSDRMENMEDDQFVSTPTITPMKSTPSYKQTERDEEEKQDKADKKKRKQQDADDE